MWIEIGHGIRRDSSQAKRISITLSIDAGRRAALGPCIQSCVNKVRMDRFHFLLLASSQGSGASDSSPFRADGIEGHTCSRELVRRTLEVKTMNHTVEFLLNHGYVVLFAWVLAEQAGAPIPSAPIVLAAGALVGFGRMSCAAALGLPVAACLIADGVWFWLGQRHGPAILRLLHRISLHPNGGTSEMRALLSRYGPASIVLSKFVPGLGILVPPLAGYVEVAAWNFLLLDVSGALAWAGSHLLLGYLFRKNLESLAFVCGKAACLIVASFVAALALVATIRIFQYSRTDRNSLTEPVAPAIRDGAGVV
jgi:membrane protein DedA with SNARE-associated domain